MSIFDIFKPEWKKQFEELVANHKDALEAYIQEKYEVFQDMRVDDRLLFEDYQKTYSSSNYAHDIESLTDQDKKHLISVKDNIVRLYRSYSKYDTKTKRVASLINRFSYNDVFNTIFGHSHFLGENWTLNTLDEDQLNFILNNYNRLVSLATGKKKEQEKRQAKQKEKLLEKVYTKRVNKYISDQAKAEAVLSMPVLNPTIVNIIKGKVTVLKQEYKSYNLYNLVRQVLLLGLDAYSPIAQDIYVLSRENVFKEASKLFDKYKNNYRVRTKLLDYLRTTTYKELCIKGLLLGHNIQIVNRYIYGQNFEEKDLFAKEDSSADHNKDTNSKTLHDYDVVKKASASKSETFQKSKPNNTTTNNIVNTPRVEIEKWKETQKEFNSIVIDWRHLLKGFKFRTTFTPIKLMVEKEAVSWHLEYIQATNLLFSETGARSDYDLYLNYCRTKEYKNCRKIYSEDNNTTLIQLLDFIDKIDRALPSHTLVVIFGTSGCEDAESFNNEQWGKLKDDLSSFGIDVVELSDIDSIEAPKYIIVLELISEIKTSRNTRKKIIKAFPGTSICYVSIYKEISQSGYELS